MENYVTLTFSSTFYEIKGYSIPIVEQIKETLKLYYVPEINLGSFMPEQNLSSYIGFGFT